MIHYLVTRGHDRYTMRRFRRSWAGPLRDRIRIHPYDRLPVAAAPGLYVFSDLERLTPAERAAAAELHARIAAAGPAFRALNDPARVLTRYELLRALHERGVNGFRAWRAHEAAEARLPAFVRSASAHEGSFSRLLRRREEIEPAIRRALRWRWRHRRDDLLVVEFQDTSGGTGAFRKYAAMRIGGVLLPRHLFFGSDWVVKRAGRPDEARLREEQEYLDAFPHRAQVEEAFGIARIDYGRIDYAVLGGRLQVWEINTNPVLVPHPRRIDPARLDRSRRFAEAAVAALAGMESALAPGDPLPLPRRGGLFARLSAALPRLPRP